MYKFITFTFMVFYILNVSDKIGNRDYVLTINDVDGNDDAEYSVHATNVVGHVSCMAQLLVYTDDGE